MYGCVFRTFNITDKCKKNISDFIFSKTFTRQISKKSYKQIFDIRLYKIFNTAHLTVTLSDIKTVASILLHCKSEANILQSSWKYPTILKLGVLREARFSPFNSHSYLLNKHRSQSSQQYSSYTMPTDQIRFFKPAI